MSTQATALRIGVVQGGQLLVDRVLAWRPRSVRVGDDPDCEVEAPGIDVRGHRPVFTRRGDHYVLNLEGLSGAVAFDGKPVDLKQIRASGQKQLALPAKTRGKLSMGTGTVLFQVVPAESVSLPKASVKAWLVGVWRREPALFRMAAASVALHAAFLGYTLGTDPIVKPPTPPQEILAMVPVTTRIAPPEKPAEKAEPDADEPAPTPAAKEPEKPKAVAHTAPPPKDQMKVLSAEQARPDPTKVSKNTILKYLGSGAGPEPLAGLGDDRLAMAFEGQGAGGVAAGPGGGGGGGGRFDGARELGAGAVAGLAGTDLGARKAVAVASGVKGPETAPQGKVSAGSGPSETLGSGQVEPNKVADVFRRRIGGLKACYERELKGNPGLQGKVVVRFTIEESGRVSGQTIVSNSVQSDRVAQCIVGQIRGWRFPQPEGGSVTVSYPLVFAPAGF